MKVVLSIAGFDPSGGAGVIADIKIFGFFRLYGASAVTSVTEQNSISVRSISPIPPKLLEKQLSFLLKDLNPAATKVGMVYTAENARVIGKIIRKYKLPNVVLDPVLSSTSGRKLASKGLREALLSEILPLCTVVTPNIHELSLLTGLPLKTITDKKQAAQVLKKLGSKSVLVTGGDSIGRADDLFYDGNFLTLHGKKVSGTFHGTGCALSSAIASLLALNCSPREAVLSAKNFMSIAFKNTMRTEHGMRVFTL